MTEKQPSSPELKNPSLFREKAYIAGRWIGADGGESLEVHNPATGELIGRVPNMGEAEAMRAIEAAESAQIDWRARTGKERAVVLRRFADLMMSHQEDLAKLMTIEQGKPLAESRGEISYAASFIEWFGEEAKRAYGDVIPAHQRDSRILVLKQAIGVAVAITPWNFPAAMITRKLGPALAAGCAMLARPSIATPFSALALAVLAEEAGVPEGVFSVITGKSGPIGKVFTGSPIVRKLSFTGSTEVGAQLMSQSAGTVKKLSLELGGNAPFLVFDDADIDAAVQGAIASKYRNAGQTCVCTNRFYVQAGVYDEFADKLAAAASELKVGNGLDEGVKIGPLINSSAVDKVERHVADCVDRGARLLLGGQRGEGTYFPPTVLTGVAADALPMREETFGPVAPLVKFDSVDQGLRLANDTEFGLAAYFYARDMARVWRVSEGLESGMVGINTGLISTELAPFGGVKSSGLGREGSKYGIDEYMELKYLCMGGI